MSERIVYQPRHHLLREDPATQESMLLLHHKHVKAAGFIDSH